MNTISDLLIYGDVDGLDKALRLTPVLALERIPLPGNPATAHPLHRICDGVFSRRYSEDTGLRMAKLLISHGSDVNGGLAGEDSPLTAACSLRCDRIANYYIDQGARIDHKGCHGGTALHWASWCGRDAVVKKLLALNPEINALCIDYRSTPLFWAIHGYKFGGKDNIHHQVACARLLVEHGADTSIPNFEGYLPVQLAGEQDKEILELFKK